MPLGVLQQQHLQYPQLETVQHDKNARHSPLHPFSSMRLPRFLLLCGTSTRKPQSAAETPTNVLAVVTCWLRLEIGVRHVINIHCEVCTFQIAPPHTKSMDNSQHLFSYRLIIQLIRVQLPRLKSHRVTFLQQHGTKT
jgi:hypothetical protein